MVGLFGKALSNGNPKKNTFIINVEGAMFKKKRRNRKHWRALKKRLDSVPTAKTILIDFFQRTTIAGLNPLGFSTNFWYKASWILLFILCLTMGLYQSSSLIALYQRYPVFENTAKDIYPKIKFPAVSVCLNSPVRWMNYSDDAGQSIVANTLEEFKKTTHPSYSSTTDTYDHREMKLLEEIARLNRTERIKLGYPINMPVIKCTWNGGDCLQDLHLFNNIHFGTCFTFNPGFNDSLAVFAGKSNSLMMIVRSDFPDQFPYLRRDEVMFVSLHAPGVAPVLDRRQMHSLFRGRWLKLGITDTKEIVRLPAPYPSKCVDETNHDVQKKSYFYYPETPYQYSVEACTQTCLQNATILSCDCIIPMYPLPSVHPYKVCRNEECSIVDDEIQCDCPRPCRELQHSFQVSIDDRWLNQQIWLVNLLLFSSIYCKLLLHLDW
ncbi:acid-sensing (proton-gated) ion channel [Chamberlinius hualienensis]